MGGWMTMTTAKGSVGSSAALVEADKITITTFRWSVGGVYLLSLSGKQRRILPFVDGGKGADFDRGGC
jgi:hypothetical protein